MENAKARVNIYDYGKNKSFGKKVSVFLSKVFEMLFFVCLVVFVCYAIYKYTNTNDLNTIEEMTKFAAEDLYLINNNGGFDKGYKVVYFPDEDGIITTNGYINNDMGESLKEFDDGYIIMYSDGSYSFELVYNNYCVEKGLADEKYTVHIFKKCNVNKLDDLK